MCQPQNPGVTNVRDRQTSGRAPAVLVLLVALVCLVLAPVAPTQAATSTGKVRGAIVQAGGGPAPKVKMLWFASDWTYLGARKVGSGVYSLDLRPGRYFLQFVDQRPAYDVSKNRPSTVSVQVSTGRTTVKNVKMVRGSALGGQVKAGGKPAAGARVVAATADEQSFETTADSQGRFALGGLPAGSYSVFTYDKQGRWTGKSTYVRKLKSREFRSLGIRLTTRAGTMLVDLYAGDQPFNGVAYPTVVNRSTGQFWTGKAKRGSVTFTGLHPGRYRMQVPPLGDYLAATVNLTATVRAGKVTFSSARLTKRGGWVTGTVVADQDGHALAGATVRLLDGSGRELHRTTSGPSGGFTLSGQLTTRSDLTVLAGPGPYSPYLDDCPYDVARLDGVRVTTNRQTALGKVGLQLTDGAPAQCQPATTPRSAS